MQISQSCCLYMQNRDFTAQQQEMPRIVCQHFFLLPNINVLIFKYHKMAEWMISSKFFVKFLNVRNNDTVSSWTYLDLELRSFGFSEYLLFECFSRDFDRLRECLLLWRRLLGDFDLERERPIFPSLIVFSPDSIAIYEQPRDRFRYKSTQVPRCEILFDEIFTKRLYCTQKLSCRRTSSHLKF